MALDWLFSKSCTFENHSKCRIWILAFYTNFCPIQTNMSGNTVWQQASGFQKLAKMDHFWHFLMNFLSTQNVNVARSARNVEWDFFCDFQTPWSCRQAVAIKSWKNCTKIHNLLDCTLWSWQECRIFASFFRFLLFWSLQLTTTNPFFVHHC